MRRSMTIRPNRRLCGGFVTVLLAAALLAPSTGSARAGRRNVCKPSGALAGTTIVRASDSQKTKVRLSQTVHFSGEWPSNPDFDVFGKGDLIAFVLRQEKPDETGITLIGGRLPTTGAFGPEKREFLLAFFGGGITEGHELPAGTYSLYLLGDGYPIEAVLRLRGLGSTTEICPNQRANATMEMLPEHISAPPSPIYTSGQVGTLGSLGMAFYTLSMKGDVWAAGDYGACVHRGGVADPQVVAHLPACPTAEDGLINHASDAVVRPASHTTFFGATGNLPPDDWGVSMWNAGVAAMSEADSFAFWLGYE